MKKWYRMNVTFDSLTGIGENPATRVCEILSNEVGCSVYSTRVATNDNQFVFIETDNRSHIYIVNSRGFDFFECEKPGLDINRVCGPVSKDDFDKSKAFNEGLRSMLKNNPNKK